MCVCDNSKVTVGSVKGKRPGHHDRCLSTAAVDQKDGTKTGDRRLNEDAFKCCRFFLGV